MLKEPKQIKSPWEMVIRQILVFHFTLKEGCNILIVSLKQPIKKEVLDWCADWVVAYFS